MNWLILAGVLGGWVARMAFDHQSVVKSSHAYKEAYRERCEAQGLRDEARCLRRAARMDAEFVESVLVTDSKVFQR